MTLLIASIACESPASAEADAAAALRAGATAIEWRIDDYEKDAEALRAVILRFTHVPCIVTCRSAPEGGAFSGDTMQRVARLIEVARRTGAYVDFEFADWQRSDNIRQKVLLAAADPAGGEPRLILSHHCFDAAPDDPIAVLATMPCDDRARVVKLAWKARDLCDNLTAFDLMRAADCAGGGPARIVICMGEEGRASRILAGKFGAWGTYASQAHDRATAPGQLSIDEMIEDFRWKTINADTAWYGVIGHPVAHSRSPMLFNRLFRQHGLNAVYLPLDVANEDVLARWLDGVRDRPWLDVRGFSITMPHKVAALRLADDVPDARTRRIGSVNTLVLRGARYHAYNTDAPAAIESLTSALALSSADLRGLSVDVLGTGGAARAVCAGLIDAGAEVTLFGRNVKTASSLAAAFGCQARSWAERTDGSGEVLINATNIGMWPKVEDSPMPAEGLSRRRLVFDLIYNPLQTRLLSDAAGAGAAVLSGLDMFARQAALQFRLWTGRSADVSVLRAWIRESLCGPQDDHPPADEGRTRTMCNIVLIGYRGSGKTTVARLLSARLGWSLVDTDEWIVQQTGRSIAELFQQEGEAGFRRIESDIISHLKPAGPCVLSVGGGAVEHAENMAVLKRLGWIVWLTAPAETLYARIQADVHTRAQRPALTPLSGLDEVRAVLSRREALYRRACDLEIATDGWTAEQVAQRILDAYGAVEKR